MTERGGHQTAPVIDSTGIQIRLVATEKEARAAVGALATIWRRAENEAPLPSELAWVFARSGNYVAVATDRERIVGTAVAFRSEDEEGPHLHSHIVGVVPSHQGSNVGYLLKQHQRRWALNAGFDRITWTFDPLIARNTYFNVAKLGAQVTSYHVDFYGEMTDAINSGDESDRCVATWRLSSDVATAASRGEIAVPDIAALQVSGAALILAPNDAGEPILTPARSPVQIVAVPPDIVEIRRVDAALARAWRHALRQTLVTALSDGREVIGVGRGAHYVLAPGSRGAQDSHEHATAP